jgi:hypothetical protein
MEAFLAEQPPRRLNDAVTRRRLHVNFHPDLPRPSDLMTPSLAKEAGDV